MRLRTKMVLTATGLTFAIVLVLSVLFLGELLRQRIETTGSNGETQTRQIVQATRQAYVAGITQHPPAALPPGTSQSDAEVAFEAAVIDALRSNDALADAMNTIVRYSPPVLDVSVTDAHGFTLVSTDPDELNQAAGYRQTFASLRDGNLLHQVKVIYGKPRALDISAPLLRNGAPFLIVHLGVRSDFMRNAYEPWLKSALELAVFVILVSVVAAALLSALALSPVRAIGKQLEQLALPRGEMELAQPELLPEPAIAKALELRDDPVGDVSRAIDKLGREMRSREEGFTALEANMNRMLDTLRDGVVLFTAERRAVMVSDAVANFLRPLDELGVERSAVRSLVGLQMEDIFWPRTALGAAVLEAFEGGRHVPAQMVTLEDGRQVQISLDPIEDMGGVGTEVRRMGMLLTLRDVALAAELEQELEVSRRLAAIGKLTSGVGHEVKNPINAMVVHLELLKAKLAANGEQSGAQRHVDILADEMQRLDRVVQTLADFSRPMELNLRPHDLREVVSRVVELTREELTGHGVTVELELPEQPVPVRVDAEMMRQSLLNLVLNAMQAMPEGGRLRLTLHRESRMAAIEVADTGVGIPDSVLPKIFDLYFTTKSTGSGIGLAMTYRILQLHGGALDVRSNTDAASTERGTVFTVRIPMATGPQNSGQKLVARVGREPDAVEAARKGSVAANIEPKENR